MRNSKMAVVLVKQLRNLKCFSQVTQKLLVYHIFQTFTPCASWDKTPLKRLKA